MRVISLSVPDATMRLAELKSELGVAIKWKTTLDSIHAALRARLQELPPRGRSLVQQQLAEALSAAITDVEMGCAVKDGVSEHIAVDIAGKPGLADITEQIPKLRKDIRLVRRHLGRWPTETATHPYRFTGSTGLTFFEGRELAAGDVVNLTRAQAAGWRDRFDDVEESAAQKAS